MNRQKKSRPLTKEAAFQNMDSLMYLNLSITRLKSPLEIKPFQYLPFGLPEVTPAAATPELVFELAGTLGRANQSLVNPTLIGLASVPKFAVPRPRLKAKQGKGFNTAYGINDLLKGSSSFLDSELGTGTRPGSSLSPELEGWWGRDSTNPAFLYGAMGKAVEITSENCLEKTGVAWEDRLYRKQQNLREITNPETVDREEFRALWLQVCCSWGEKKILAMKGILNALAFQAHRAVKALVEERTTEDGQTIWRAVSQRVRALMAGAVRMMLRCATAWITDHLNEHWMGHLGEGETISEVTVRKYLRELQELGLVDWDETAYKAGRYGKCRVYTYLDFTAMVMASEVLESVLLAEARSKLTGLAPNSAVLFDALPEHKGYVDVLLHNAGIPGFGYGRTGEPDEVEPTTYADSDRRRDLLKPLQPEPEHDPKAETPFTGYWRVDEHGNLEANESACGVWNHDGKTVPVSGQPQGRAAKQNSKQNAKLRATEYERAKMEFDNVTWTATAIDIAPELRAHIRRWFTARWAKYIPAVEVQALKAQWGSITDGLFPDPEPLPL